jgi:hypothetical protein
MSEAIAVALLLLLIGDLLSTFCYHVPEHVFGRLHLRTHHSAKKNFRHYAILTFDAQVLLDGILGALPYLLVAPFLWRESAPGAIAGLLLGLFHVWWRHTTSLGWQTPPFLAGLCQVAFIITPEQHWQHHQNPYQGFGDIFTFFDRPAKAWLRCLRFVRLNLRYWRLSSLVAITGK